MHGGSTGEGLVQVERVERLLLRLRDRVAVETLERDRFLLHLLNEVDRLQDIPQLLVKTSLKSA